MFIIDDFISYWFHKLLDSLFGKKEDSNKYLIGLLKIRDIENKRLNEENLSLKTRQGDLIIEGGKVINSLKQRKFSIRKVLNKYNKPLMSIIISYATQKEEKKKGSYVGSSFIKVELEKYNSKYLGGTDAIIPTTNVPKGIKNKEDLREWFEKMILKGRYCKIKFIALVDISKDVYWGKYIPYVQKDPKHFTIGEVFSIDDILTEEEVKTISFIEIIKEGDILWLLSPFLSKLELDKILKNQDKIEHELKNPPLEFYAKTENISKINKVLNKYINTKNHAEFIQEEAIFWVNKINFI